MRKDAWDDGKWNDGGNAERHLKDWTDEEGEWQMENTNQYRTMTVIIFHL